MATGGLTLVPGSGEVMIGMVDPAVYFGHGVCANGPRRSSNLATVLQLDAIQLLF